MKMYKSLTRTTIGDLAALPHVGIYIIAYLGKVIYIGKASDSVMGRLEAHINRPTPIGVWLRCVDDRYNIRLDVLEAPDVIEVEQWLDKSESALIRRFKPLFNIALM
jgi:hypothetical protein